MAEFDYQVRARSRVSRAKKRKHMATCLRRVHEAIPRAAFVSGLTIFQLKNVRNIVYQWEICAVKKNNGIFQSFSTAVSEPVCSLMSQHAYATYTYVLLP